MESRDRGKKGRGWRIVGGFCREGGERAKMCFRKCAFLLWSAAIRRRAARDATGDANGNAERDDTWGAEMVTAVNTNTHEHTGIGFTITGGRVRA